MFGGGALVVGGIAAFIEANAHHPCFDECVTLGGPSAPLIASGPHEPSRLSQPVYDLLRVGGSALVIFGALLLIVGLVRFWAAR
jgi:hypothetical protein